MRSTNDASSACFNSSLSLNWGRVWGRGACGTFGILTDPWGPAGVSPEYTAWIPYGQEGEPTCCDFRPDRPGERWSPRPRDRPRVASALGAGHEVVRQA